jgi:hypothetical protein
VLRHDPFEVPPASFPEELGPMSLDVLRVQKAALSAVTNERAQYPFSLDQG